MNDSGPSMSALQDQVAAAFPDREPWTDPISGCPPEIADINREFRGKGWRDVPPEQCNRHSDAYTMMDAEPLAFFLPAFQSAAVADPLGHAALYLVFFACSETKVDDVYRRLTVVQRTAFVGVVNWLIDNDGHFASGERDEFDLRLLMWDERPNSDRIV